MFAPPRTDGRPSFILKHSYQLAVTHTQTLFPSWSFPYRRAACIIPFISIDFCSNGHRQQIDTIPLCYPWISSTVPIICLSGCKGILPVRYSRGTFVNCCQDFGGYQPAGDDGLNNGAEPNNEPGGKQLPQELRKLPLSDRGRENKGGGDIKKK